jgi:hypothetical protein
LAGFACPYLSGSVELTDERERHIASRHPDLLPEHRERLVQTIVDPDQVRRSGRFGDARLFSKWFSELRGGKYIVVVIISEPEMPRHWIITAYIARELSGGAIEWARS